MEAAAESEQRLREAIARHRSGDHNLAEAGYREYLRDHPRDPSGLHFLGLLRNHQGRNEEAIKLMVAALEVDPDYVDAWSNLGIVYYQQRDLERAEFCARKALEIRPEFANAWANLGMTLRARNACEEALIAWGRALDLQPDMRNIAISYGHLLYRVNRLTEALEFYERWRDSAPDDPIPQHMLAAMGGARTPGRASDGYVRATFDDFAESFDRNLEELGYKAPQILFEAVRSAALSPQQGLDIVDLGCGTGLCGSLFRPLARRLVGVDLSPGMLSKAAIRAVYDQLNCGELTQWLAECAQRFDVAIAADVLCYFGELDAAFRNVRQVLKPGGLFSCTLERSPDEPPGSSTDPSPFILRPHGRYQHHAGYVETALQDAGMTVLSLTTDVLRYERRDPVIGLVIVAQRPAMDADG